MTTNGRRSDGRFTAACFERVTQDFGGVTSDARCISAVLLRTLSQGEERSSETLKPKTLGMTKSSRGFGLEPVDPGPSSEALHGQEKG